jgi:flavin reductase (DIM6/NTAB) family NADH-FMN oxidoreductase RutF
MNDTAKELLGKPLGKISSGVYILSAAKAGQSAAMMVSWVMQASFAPPMLTIAMARDRHIRKYLEIGNTFALSILAKTDNALMKKYARGIPEDEDPFAGIAIAQTPGGATYLSESLGWLECRLSQIGELAGDHDLFIAEVTGGQQLKDEPAFTHTRGNGFHY